MLIAAVAATRCFPLELLVALQSLRSCSYYSISVINAFYITFRYCEGGLRSSCSYYSISVICAFYISFSFCGGNLCASIQVNRLGIVRTQLT